MSFDSTYTIKEKARELYLTVESEKENLKTSRAFIKIFYKNGSCIFNVKAKDFTSFRAMNNAVVRMITVFNKVGEI